MRLSKGYNIVLKEDADSLDTNTIKYYKNYDIINIIFDKMLKL